MDDPDRSDQELRETLRELGWINRWFGARAFVQDYLDRVLPIWQEQAAGPLTVLDVATGGADIPIAIAQWGARRGIPVRVIAVDRHQATVRLAREITAGHPAISVIRADALALPFADKHFDVCLCSLALHHLEPGDAGGFLRRLHSLARVGFLVVDLVRGWSAYTAVWLLTRCAHSPLIRHDGPVSVRRALSWQEYRGLATAAGIPGIQVFKLPLFRVALARTI
jgi:SAM-dependent methyltransferase